MIINQMHLLNNILKNSDKYKRIQLDGYSVNISKEEISSFMEQTYSSKRLKIVGRYVVLVLKFQHAAAQFQQYGSNSKTTPISRESSVLVH